MIRVGGGRGGGWGKGEMGGDGAASPQGVGKVLSLVSLR